MLPDDSERLCLIFRGRAYRLTFRRYPDRESMSVERRAGDDWHECFGTGLAENTDKWARGIDWAIRDAYAHGTAEAEG